MENINNSKKLKRKLFISVSLMCISDLYKVCRMSKNKRVQVVFANKQWELLSNTRGKMGDSDADIIGNIVVSWLSEKTITTLYFKNEMELLNKGERGA